MRADLIFLYSKTAHENVYLFRIKMRVGVNHTPASGPQADAVAGDLEVSVGTGFGALYRHR